jgi:hypothetical protein
MGSVPEQNGAGACLPKGDLDVACEEEQKREQRMEVEER